MVAKGDHIHLRVNIALRHGFAETEAYTAFGDVPKRDFALASEDDAAFDASSRTGVTIKRSIKIRFIAGWNSTCGKAERFSYRVW
jgi:hypothetical protein